MFMFKTLKNFFFKDEVGRKEDIVKTAGDRSERLLWQNGLTYKSLFEMMEDVNFLEGLEKLFEKMNNLLMPLLLLDDEMYEEVKQYLEERACSKRLDSALDRSKVLKDALFIYKSDITKNVDQYLVEKEKHLEETNIMDKIQKITNLWRNISLNSFRCNF